MSEENRRRGKVKFFDMKKGFGFIIPFEGIQEHFVHRDNIVFVSKTGIAGLFDGEEVEYELGAKEDGRPAAFEVRPTVSRLGGTVLDFDDDRGQGEIQTDSDQRVLDEAFGDLGAHGSVAGWAVAGLSQIWIHRVS